MKNINYKYEIFFIDLIDLIVKSTQEITTEYSKTNQIQSPSFSLIIKKAIDYINSLDTSCAMRKSKYHFLIIDQPYDLISCKVKFFNPVRYKNLDNYNEVIISLFCEVLKNYDSSFIIENLGFSELEDYIKDNKSSRKNLLISRDMLWASYISEATFWNNYSLTLNKKNFEKYYKFESIIEKIVLSKVLLGQTPQDPNLLVNKSIPKEVIFEIINKYKDFESFIKNFYLVKTDKIIYDSMKENYSLYKSNYQKVLAFLNYKYLEKKKILGSKNSSKIKLWYQILELPYEKWMRKKSAKEKK
jgi:hypothetical protein